MKSEVRNYSILPQCLFVYLVAVIHKFICPFFQYSLNLDSKFRKNNVNLSTYLVNQFMHIGYLERHWICNKNRIFSCTSTVLWRCYYFFIFFSDKSIYIKNLNNSYINTCWKLEDLHLRFLCVFFF